MKLTRCPICHSHIDLMSLIEDEAGRSLLIEVAKMEAWFAQSLLSYVSLFKPLKSDLNNGRALKLLQETTALTSNKQLLVKACAATVQSIREKRQKGQTKPLKDHMYLKRVIESMPEPTATVNNMGNAIIKEQGMQTTKEENDAAFKKQMEQLGGKDKFIPDYLKNKKSKGFLNS